MAGLAGEIRPVGVRGLDEEVPLATVNFFPGVRVPVKPVDLRGIRDGVSSTNFFLS